MDVNDILGGTKLPPGLKFETVGTKYIVNITEDPKSVPVREFIKGKPADQLYFQGQKKVRQSDLNLQLPYEPIPAILVVGKLKDGTEVSIRFESEKLRALRKAVREGGQLVKGGMVAIEFTAEDDSGGGPFAKKLYEVQLKAPKSSD